MNIQEMTYFETMDVEQGLGQIERHRKALISELSDLCGRLRDTEHFTTLDDLATTLEEADDLLSEIWDQVTARQEEIETKSPGQVLALNG